MFLERLIRTLNSHKLPYAIVGGYAVALHGAVRGTIDIDLVIQFQESHFIKLEKVLTEIGLESKIPVKAS
jgi:hypothetical protein